MYVVIFSHLQDQEAESLVGNGTLRVRSPANHFLQLGSMTSSSITSQNRTPTRRRLSVHTHKPGRREESHSNRNSLMRSRGSTNQQRTGQA